MRTCASTLESELDPEALNYLQELLAERSMWGLHVEIGTAAGGTLRKLLEVYDSKAKRPSFLVIDPMTYFPNQLDVVMQNVEHITWAKTKLRFEIASSSDAFARFRSRSGGLISFLLIDGSHKIKYVANDTRWLEHLEVGGVVAFDDYGAGFPGVDWVVHKIMLPNTDFKKIAIAGRLIAFEKVGNTFGAPLTIYQRILANVLHPCFQIRMSLRKRLPTLARKSE